MTRAETDSPKTSGPPGWFRYGAALLCFFLLLGLGTWQLDRRAWKRDLIAARAAGVAADPLSALPPSGADLAAFEYRRIRLSGVFRHDAEMYVPGREYRSQAGFHVLTPFLADDGAQVIVNRGFVTPDRQPADKRAAGNVAGPVTIEGLIRLPFRGNAFTPDNRPDQKLWFTHDLPAMARHLELPALAPVLIEAGPAANPGNWPVGGQTRLDLPNNHLQYALTWYALAIVLAVIVTMLWRRERAERAGA